MVGEAQQNRTEWPPDQIVKQRVLAADRFLDGEINFSRWPHSVDEIEEFRFRSWPVGSTYRIEATDTPRSYRVQ